MKRKSFWTFALVVLFPLTVFVYLLVTDVAVKSVRYFLDRQQYGRSKTSVRTDAATERRMREAKSTAERVDMYHRYLENQQRFATWPSVQNFTDEWRVRSARYDDWTRNYEAESMDRSEFKGVWYVRDQLNPTRKILFFLHGGATFAGSPYKYNNLHWLETVGWLGAMDGRFTDLCSVDYRLQPEHTIHDGVSDCLAAIERVVGEYARRGRRTKDLHLVGFSAGGMLALQCAMLVEAALRSMTESSNWSNSPLFGFHLPSNKGDPLHDLCELWKTIDGTKRLVLISPLCRLDRLFINDGYDCSTILATFSKAFFDRHATTYDPLYNMVKRKLSLEPFDDVLLVDVCRNSLSNHVVHLDQTIRRFGRNTRRGRMPRTIVLDERDLLIDHRLARQILEYETKRGLRQHKFVEHVAREQQRIEAERSLRKKDTTDLEGKEVTTTNHSLSHFTHHHFFMYIVPANASWKLLSLVLSAEPRGT